MSWHEAYSNMHNNISDGTEFCKTKEDIILVKESKTQIGHCKCEYCGKDLLAIWDNNNKQSWYPYLGNQARKFNTYSYSPIINIMRKYYNVENKVWDEDHGNNLMNLHARAHSKPNNWAKRAHPNGIKILCNNCFQKTYQRIKVQGNDGYLYSLSVLPDRGETIQSVMKDLDITGTVIGKGAINNY